MVTVSEATLVAMSFAATSKPVHMVANPGKTQEYYLYVFVCNGRYIYAKGVIMKYIRFRLDKIPKKRVFLL